MLLFEKNFILFLFFIGVEFSKSDATSVVPYTPSPIDLSSAYKNSVYCDFINKSCSWSATGIWKWDSGETDSSQLDGPLARSKYYQYTPLVANFNKDPKSDKKSYDKQSLTSLGIDAPSKGTSCFSFNFYTLLSEASNDGITLFLVDIDDEKNKTAIWAHGNSAIDDWLEARVDVFTNKKFKLMFEAYGRHGFVGVEKFNLHSGPCGDKKCDFEGGMCTGWTTESQPAENNFKVIKAGSTSFKHPFDHTSHSSFGHFAYSSGPVTPGNIALARMISPEMKDLNSQCLTFYFMRTSNDVSLKLLQRFTGNSSYRILWQSNATHSFNQWMAVTQTLKISDEMQFIIEAGYTKDASLKTGIAIDDVLMQPYSCDDQITCTFVRKFCGWEPNRNVGLQWSVGSGRVERADKLKKKEKISTYTSLLYTDFTTLEDDDTDSMELISQPIQPHPEGGYCLHLDINVIALGPKDEVSLSQIDPNDKRTVIWNFKDLKKDPKDEWIRGIKIWTLNLSGGLAFRLALTAKSSTPYARIAVDSVHLYKCGYLCGGVSTILTETTKPIAITNSYTVTTEPSSIEIFHCDNGKNIPISKLCDGVKDCGNSGEDEKHCGSCNFFNHDFCGYKNVIENPNAKWKFGDEYSDYKEDAEYSDYVQARTDSHIDFDDKDQNLVAILESPTIRNSYSSCHISFTYRPNGTATTNLMKVFILNFETKVKKIIYESNFDQIESLSWHSISLNLGRIHHEHKLGFRGEFSTNDFQSHSLKHISRTDCDAPHPVANNEDCNDEETFMCANKVCIDANQVCNFVDDCGDSSDEKNCDTTRMISFSEGYGNWKPKPAGDSSVNGFQIKSSKDFHSYRAGPLYDHTAGVEGIEGRFLFFKQTTVPKDETKPITADLESGYFKLHRNCRMSFFYFKNSRKSTIKVTLEDKEKPDNRVVLNEYSSYGYSWNKASLAFLDGTLGNIYKVIITSSVDFYTNEHGVPMSYIAIDDISLSKECEFL